MCALSSQRGKPVLLNFWSAGAECCKADWIAFNQRYAAWAGQGLQLLTVNLDTLADAESVPALAHQQHLSFPILRGSEDVAAIYNILYRYLFDRHRDLELPTSFLIDAKGKIVKVYQGPVDPEHVEQDFRHIPKTSAERLARALPFPGVTDAIDFGRNYLSYGSVFFQRGYMDQAAASFQIALRDDPTSAEALYGIGSVYLNQQKTWKLARVLNARSNFARAIPTLWQIPGTTWAYWPVAKAAQAKRSLFSTGAQAESRSLIALDNLGSVYRQQKRWDDARRTYERALEISSNDAEANYGLGMVFAQNDDTRERSTLCRKR
jgi:tetratricopeptide (TPR) repeat protein